MTSVGGADTSNVKQAADYPKKRSTNIEKLMKKKKEILSISNVGWKKAQSWAKLTNTPAHRTFRTTN